MEQSVSRFSVSINFNSIVRTKKRAEKQLNHLNCAQMARNGAPFLRNGCADSAECAVTPPKKSIMGQFSRQNPRFLRLRAHVWVGMKFGYEKSPPTNEKR